MANTITAGNATNNGLALASDATGVVSIVTGSGSGTTAVTVDASQNVGIGTSSPASRMHLSGSDSTGPAQLKITNTTAAATRNIGVSNSNQLVFERAGVATDVVIDSSGNLLVNATANWYYSSKLFANGGSTTNGFAAYCGSSGGAAICGLVNATNINYAFFSYAPNGPFNVTGSVTTGSISTNGTTTSYNTTSDYRLKENVVPMTGALARIAALKPVSYTWKSNNSAGEGFIAHELAEVMPDAVTGEKDAVDADGNPVYQGIDTSFLVATLTAAIQEQQAMIEELKAKVAALEAK